MRRDEIKKEIERQNETPLEAPEPTSIYELAPIIGGEFGPTNKPVVIHDEEELRKLVDAPSEFERVAAELAQEDLEKARRERRCPRCMALLMETGLPEGRCPNGH